jgi:branched-chain amino acid transport system ATP-binding protein
MLDVDRIDVYYGYLQVLYEVSLYINKGEIVALLGPNSAGKTTTLKTIIGLLKPRKGNIIFMGRKINNLPPHEIVRKGIALVPDYRAIFPKLSVLENLELGSYVCRDREKREEMLRIVFELFPILKERKNQLAGTLSGGEQQMLAIGKALMADPKLLLLDEPSAGLMPKLLPTLFNAIKTLNKEYGITILLAEQNVYTTLDIVQRAYIIENGTIIFEGNPEDLLKDERIRKTYLGI